MRTLACLERVWKMPAEREQSPLAAAGMQLSCVPRPGTGRAQVSESPLSIVLLLFVATLLVGCVSSPDWTRRVYSFSLAPDPPTTNAPNHIVALNRVAISPLFQSRSFTYLTAQNSYEQDPYAGFLIPPERALAESIRASMRAGSVFGRVVDPGSGLTPTLVAEVFVNELYGDFRNPARPVGKMELHFVCYEVKDGRPGRVVLDTVSSSEMPLTKKTPDALMAAWDADLQNIMEQINADYTKAKAKP